MNVLKITNDVLCLHDKLPSSLSFQISHLT
jgi:hypothetical protein